MVFTSFNFLMFFPVLVLVFWITPAKYRWITLLIASYFFYINVKPVFALLVAGITLSTYFFTRLIDNTEVEAKKKKYMIINIMLILLPLFFYKYFGTINTGLIALMESLNVRWPLPEIKLILPIGISFYTFMAIGYTIDVYNEEIKAEKNLGIVALLMSFFPLILSGPIERAKNMLPQFKTPREVNFNMISQGIKLMLWGYFMKLVVADRIGIYVDAVYDNILQHNGTSLLFASILYPFQIYCDLGGYSLIAIGSAIILGINVMQNFKRPFFATSMAEFWRRWHISLISWLTDYVYTPLSFTLRKFKVWGVVIALMTTFLISGIWHGASLTYVVWGIMQGVFLSFEALTKKKRSIFEKSYNLKKKSWYIFLEISLTYILFSASQIFGRSTCLNDALIVFQKIFKQPGPLYLDKTTFTYAFLGILIIFTKDFLEEYIPERVLLFNNRSIVIRFGSYLLILFLILLIGVLNASQFIYFKF